MKAVLFSIAAVLTTFAAISSYQNSNTPAETFSLRFDDKCPEALAVECAASIQITHRDCEKALKDHDLNAEMSCIKDLLSDRKVCWPCICEITDKYVKL